MSVIEHEIVLTTEGDIGHRVPPEALARVLRHVGPAVRQSLLMAFEGRSTLRGRTPAWVTRASDVRCVGISGRRETVLHFEAPRLGDAAEPLYRQLELPDLSPARPPVDSTGFDLLAAAILDVSRRSQDSARFDERLLSRILQWGNALGGVFRAMSLAGRDSTKERAELNAETMANARDLRTAIPPPRRVRLVGSLDMIRASTDTFAIRLQDGQEAPGVLLDGRVGSLRDLFGHRVLVLGDAVFRPSGRLLRVDADEVRSGETEPDIWSQMPRPRGFGAALQDLRQPQSPKTGAAAIFGQWPGDETEEELLAALRELS